MAEYLIQSETLDDIADAINAKTGGSSAMTPAEMAAAISAISGGSTPILPSAYQQVEYIEATGTQYINTGLMPTENNVAEVDFELTGYTNASYIALVSASTHMYLVHFAHTSGSDVRFVPNWYRYVSDTIYQPLNLNQRYKALCVSWRSEQSSSTGGCAITVGGAFTVNRAALSTYTPTNNYFIFARNNGGGAVSYQAKAKLYGLTLYTDGAKRREFYPCYRKADGAIGLYDVVNDTFYTNIGTGTFGKGGDV